MKTNILKYTLIAVSAAALAAGCSLFGANPSAPTQTEAKLFDIETNTIPQVVTRTNVVTTTNVVNLPSPTGVPMLTTNFVTATNVVTLTNQVDQYQYTPKSGLVSTVQTIGTVSGPFTAGIGTMISTGVVALLGIWAGLRSKKMGDTSTALTQEIEAVRNFILTLPQGTKIDAAVTQFMQQHQTEAGVAQTVLKLIDGNTSDPTIAGISNQLQEAITTLTATPAPKV